MTLVKFNVGGKLFMMKRAVLEVEKSEYFAALLDGPLKARENEDGVIELQEEDADTLKQLFFFIQTGKLSEMVKESKSLYEKLEMMAGFYLVDIFPFYTDKPVLFTYKSLALKITNPRLFIENVLSLAAGPNRTDVSPYSQCCFLLIQLFASGDVFTNYLCAQDLDAGCYSIVIVSKYSPQEMESRHPGFSTQFTLISHQL